MKKLTGLLAAVLVFLLVLSYVLDHSYLWKEPPVQPTEESTNLSSTATSEAASSEASTETVLPTETVIPTETVPPTETVIPTETVLPTEPPKNTYLISFAGDCTFADNLNNPPDYTGTFTQVVGDNFAYPFAKVKDYFASDDLSLVNLEFAFTSYDPTEEEMKHFGLHEKTYRFRADPKYTQVLHEGSIECVSAANNHSKDFANPGHEDTKRVLTEAGIRYATWGSNCLYTTPSGLKVGIYAYNSSVTESHMKTNIEKLRKQGAEIVICSLHWGDERTYHPTEKQMMLGHLAIDYGADIVFGHHPHVLQPIEYYNGGVILYSMGNFSFGGNRGPRDKDTAIIQQEILRLEDGSVTLGQTIIIPCSLTSSKSGNNYQPRPYAQTEEGYQRVMSKLDWSYATQWKAEQDAATAPTEITEVTDPTETT